MHAPYGSRLSFAKLSATPTDTAWSQVYNAGNLFVCFSLTRREPSEDTSSLQSLGKGLLNHFESEFFTLEEKNLETIKQALLQSIHGLPQKIELNLCLAYVKENVLMLFLFGEGRLILKRGEKLGVLLEKKSNDHTLRTASGYLQNDDILFLATQHFLTQLSDKQIDDSLNLSLPNDIAEELSVPMHAKTDGAQAAIVISYQGVGQQKEMTEEEKTHIQEEQDDLAENDDFPSREKKRAFLRITLPRITLPLRIQLSLRKIHLSHSRKLFLSIIVILAMILTISIIFTKQQQETKHIEAQFNAVYPQALQYYDEGKALQNLNKSLSDEALNKAKELLLAEKDTFPPESKESQQIIELLTKVQAELTRTAESTTEATETSVEKTSLLAIEQKTKGIATAQDDTTVYRLTNQEVTSIAKNNGEEQALIKNDDAWTNPTGIAVYHGNLYVLDQGNTILKYVAEGDGFGKSSYFTDPPNLTKAVDLAIDSAIYVLFSDGTMTKYLRGEAEPFTIKGLDVPFSQPAKIRTTADMENIYILDPQNSRIVVFDKNGTFQKEYVTNIIQQAKDFDVTDDEQTLLVLANEKIWEIAL